MHPDTERAIRRLERYHVGSRLLLVKIAAVGILAVAAFLIVLFIIGLFARLLRGGL